MDAPVIVRDEDVITRFGPVIVGGLAQWLTWAELVDESMRLSDVTVCYPEMSDDDQRGDCRSA